MGRVKERPCCACGKPGPSEAHHCRDMPPLEDQGIYQRLPAQSRKSGDLDTIPLCQSCHHMFHAKRLMFHSLYGKDYEHIRPTRDALQRAGEL